MTEHDYRRLFDRVSPGPELVERTIEAAEGGVRPRRRAPLRRLAALAACVGLVLGLFNYQALAAGAERVLSTIKPWPPGRSGCCTISSAWVRRSRRNPC